MSGLPAHKGRLPILGRSYRAPFVLAAVRLATPPTPALSPRPMRAEGETEQRRGRGGGGGGGRAAKVMLLL